MRGRRLGRRGDDLPDRLADLRCFSRWCGLWLGVLGHAWFGQVQVDDADRHRATPNAVSIRNICKPKQTPHTQYMQTPRHSPVPGAPARAHRVIAIQVLGLDEKAVDSASLQRVAELKAYGLVREASDLQAVEGAEVAHVGLHDARLEARELLV